MKEVELVVLHFDSYAFSFATIDMDGVKLAALYTLQHGLARNAERLRRLLHRHIAFGDVFDELRQQFISEANAPRRVRRELFCGNETVVDPSMKRRWCDPYLNGRLSNREQLTFGRW